jgi:ATPase subunit of ABC transporter with duplicated ATPase domains
MSLGPGSFGAAPKGVLPSDNAVHHQSHHTNTFTFDANYDSISSAEKRDEEVHQLARRYTQQSIYSTTSQNPFAAEPGSKLDPNGENFSARAWCKAMLQTHTEDDRAHPLRTLGVAFTNLNVYGFGFDTDYQKSVGNVWLEALGLVRKIMGQRERKIEILQVLEGLVEAGEMLVVLGPPGAGCSTFLKTLTGQTHGFFVDKNSNLNYQGMLDAFHLAASH